MPLCPTPPNSYTFDTYLSSLPSRKYDQPVNARIYVPRWREGGMTVRIFPVVLLVGSCGSFMASAAQVDKFPDHSSRRGGFSVEQNSVRLTTTPSSEKVSSDGHATISAAQLRVPGKARDAYRKARFAMSENKLGDAARYIEKALSSYPRYTEALTLRAALEM